MKIFKRMFDMVIFVQFILFSFFILQNIYNLDEIEFALSLNEESEAISFNLYGMLGIMIAIMIIGVLAGMNLFSSGLNDSATNLLYKYIGYVSGIVLLFVGSNYYILPLGLIGVIIDIFLVIVYVFKLIEVMSNSGSE